jgi:hypothetical protein
VLSRSTFARGHSAALAGAIAVLLLAGCGGGGDATTPPPTPTIALAASPATLNFAAGAGGTSTITLTRGGGFTGDVALTATGAPAGLTVALSPTTIPAGSSSTTVTLTSAGTVAAGSYPISINGSGSGVTGSATVTAVVAAAQAPTLAVGVAPATTSIAAGASGTATATITRGGGFTGDVTMTASGAPAGMTLTFAPATIGAAATTSSIGIAVGAGVSAGSYPVTISAAGTGVTTATATLTVTVTAVSGGGSVTVAFCAEDAPIWLAVQDGTGGWTRVTPSSGTNTYQFTLPSGRGAIASVDTVGTGFDLSVIFATTAEFNGFSGTSVLATCQGKTVNGTVANVGVTQAVTVTLGTAAATVTPVLSTSFQLTNVSSGPQDLFASRLDAVTQRADRLILRRALNIPNAGSMPVLDFNAAEAFAPVAANLTVANLGSESAFASAVYTGTRGSANGTLSSAGNITSSSATRAFDLIPAAQLGSTELQQYFVFSGAGGGSSAGRFAGVYFRTPSDRTVTLGPALSAPTVTRITGGAYARVRVQLPLQTQYNRSFNASFEQSGANRGASLFATAGYVGSGAWDLSIPDLSGVSGWQNTWGLTSAAINWNVGAWGGVQFFIDTNATEGSTFQSALATGSLP